MTALAWLAAALVAAAPLAPGSAPQTRLQVRVHIDGNVQAGERLTAGLAAGVQAIWSPYGIDAMVVPAGGRLAEDGQALHLVVTDRLPPAAGAGRDGLGWIEFVAPGRPSPVLTVSASAAADLVLRARWAGAPITELPASVQSRFLAHALSRAAAHEIGHYLFRSTAHSRRGLMRREFPIAEIMDESLAPYRLEPSQILGLERRLAEVRSSRPAALSHQPKIAG